MEVGAAAQEATGRISIFGYPRPLSWPVPLLKMPELHAGLEESCWGPAQALRVPLPTENLFLPTLLGGGGWREESLDLQSRGLGSHFGAGSNPSSAKAPTSLCLSFLICPMRRHLSRWL